VELRPEDGLKKLKELVKDWSLLRPGGPFRFVPGQVEPPWPEDLNVPIIDVGPVLNEYVACKCSYLGHPHTFDLPMEDKETAERAASVIREHMGETLKAIGELEV
jgi:hypothetical protein